MCDGYCGDGALSVLVFFFFFNDTATTEIYTLSLHDALPIYSDVSIFTFGAFQNRYCNFLAKPIRCIGLLHSTN